MDVITLEDLEQLLDKKDQWCVSLFMPTHRVGRETEQDPIRFKNLLREAEELLRGKGLRSPQARDLLEPASRLLKDSAFWRYQSDGLAVFLSKDEMLFYRLPVQFNPQALVSGRFYVKPLLPLLTTDGHFYILALSQNSVKLLEGTRQTIDQVNVESMPTSMAELVRSAGLERHLQYHTRTSAQGGDRSPVFHGHDLGDEAKGRIVSWFQRLDDGLSQVIGGGQSPLVLAGVDYLLPLYRQASDYPHLLEEGITGNPEELKPEDLHQRAWAIVKPRFMKAQEEAEARYRQLAGTGRTTHDVREAVRAASQGRVDVLFVMIGGQVWGTVDPETGEAQIQGEPGTDHVDLLDVAAVRTLRNGGAAYAVEPGQVPGGESLAAVFRY